MKQWRLAIVLILIVGSALIWYMWRGRSQQNETAEIKYAVTPFQDSALPVVADGQGWYRAAQLNVRLVNMGWSDVPLALASKSADVAIYNVDSYMASSEQLEKGGAQAVFYAPLYVWNGAAIMIHGDRGLKPAGDLSKLSQDARKAAVSAAMQQLRGKRVGVTQGTTFEQTVLDALKLANMSPSKDLKLVYARPEDNLAAFLSGDLDAFSAGLTERVQAKRHGATELVIGPDFSLPAIDGLIARKEFADRHPEEMQKLVDIWFQTISYIQVDVAGRSEGGTTFAAKRV
jgi:ABC-type nitrate/sulfonate/bicarbonate transport system substrate-binding protein